MIRARNWNEIERPAWQWLVMGLMLAFGIGSLHAQVATTPLSGTAGSSTNRIDAESRELKPGDEFSFRIEEDPVKSAEPMRVVVTELGDAYFRVSRMTDKTIAVNVRGKRLEEVRAEVKGRLEKEFYHRATLTLSLTGVGVQQPAAGAPSTAKVIFFGELKAVMPLPEGEKLMLSEAVLRLGGGGGFANLKKIKVHRRDPESGRASTVVVNVDAVIYNNDPTKDLELRDGDRVEVPAKLINL